MWDRVIESAAVMFYLLAAAVAFIVGSVAGVIKKEGVGDVVLRGLEAGLVAPAGAFLARTFISGLLHLAGDSPGACLAVGWGFFLWPGLVDSVRLLLNDPPLFTAPVLLWTATGVGAFTGMMDGLWRIHPWIGLGVINFLLDVTWGLAGTTNGCLLHLINFAWGDHKDDPRGGAHRYYSGFPFKGPFAFTQGSVQSNLSPGAGEGHEYTHVVQNRLFGPLFTLTYFGWMAVMLIPGLIAGALTGGVGQGIQRWCYENNPWEAWAYAVGGEGRPASQVWSKGAMLTATVIYFLAALALTVLVVWKVWVSP